MNTKYDELMNDPEFRKEMAIESCIAEAAEVIAQLMAEQNLSKSDVANRLGKSRAWVTQLLNGKANMTIRTFAEVVFALGGQATLQTATSRKPQAPPRRETWKQISGKTHTFFPAYQDGGFQLPVTALNSQEPDSEDYAA